MHIRARPIRRCAALALMAALVAVAAIGPAALSAQSSDDSFIWARSTVIQTLSVEGVRDVDFGTMLAGASVFLDAFDPGAGKFEVLGQPGAEIEARLTQIPTRLTSLGGLSSIPVSFTGRWLFIDDPTRGFFFDPNGSGVLTRFENSGRLFVWIGGFVNPPASTPPGLYRGTMVLQAAYTGN